MTTDFGNDEFKINFFDLNIICIAQDFEKFQTTINNIHFVVIELPDANKDVLVGKRNVNFLSLGNNPRLKSNFYSASMASIIGLIKRSVRV